MKIRSVRWIAAVAMAMVGGLAAPGCGDDGGDDQADRAGDAGSDETTEATTETTETTEAAAPADADVAAYCDAELAFETAPAPEAGSANATPEQQAESGRTYGRETLRPLADAVVAAAPDELAADVDRLSSAVDELAASGDYAVFEQPEVETARDNVHAFDLDNCGWSTQEVAAREYAYDGVPAELAAGPTSFELVNGGQELHQMVLVRKNDGVTASAEELLVMPEWQSLSQITEIGSAYAAQGETDHLVVDLGPGDYIGACFLASGTTSEDEPPPQGLPHAAQGEFLEFTVN